MRVSQALQHELSTQSSAGSESTFTTQYHPPPDWVFLRLAGVAE